MSTETFGTRSLTITRHIKAPRDLVWKAWTDPEMIRQWFGPTGFTIPYARGEIKVGGRLDMAMHGPKGTPFDVDMPMYMQFREIVPGKKLVFESAPLGPGGKKMLDSLTTVTFADEDGGTLLEMQTTATALVPEGAGMLQGMEQGWTQTLDNLTRVMEA